jgi:hypothetical protein
MIEFAEKLKAGYKQPRLSQFETRKKGPPLKLVEQYADLFGLEKEARRDFFQAALDASDPVTMESKKFPPVIRRKIVDILAVFLSNPVVGEIIEKRKVSRTYGLIPNRGDPYNSLEKSWLKLEQAVANFVAEGIKYYFLPAEPTPKTAPPKDGPPDKPQDVQGG